MLPYNFRIIEFSTSYIKKVKRNCWHFPKYHFKYIKYWNLTCNSKLLLLRCFIFFPTYVFEVWNTVQTSHILGVQHTHVAWPVVLYWMAHIECYHSPERPHAPSTQSPYPPPQRLHCSGFSPKMVQHCQSYQLRYSV